jgi:hypothetical protein
MDAPVITVGQSLTPTFGCTDAKQLNILAQLVVQYTVFMPSYNVSKWGLMPQANILLAVFEAGFT